MSRIVEKTLAVTAFLLVLQPSMNARADLKSENPELYCAGLRDTLNETYASMVAEHEKKEKGRTARLAVVRADAQRVADFANDFLGSLTMKHRATALATQNGELKNSGGINYTNKLTHDLSDLAGKVAAKMNASLVKSIGNKCASKDPLSAGSRTLWVQPFSDGQPMVICQGAAQLDIQLSALPAEVTVDDIMKSIVANLEASSKLEKLEPLPEAIAFVQQQSPEICLKGINEAKKALTAPVAPPAPKGPNIVGPPASRDPKVPLVCKSMRLSELEGLNLNAPKGQNYVVWSNSAIESQGMLKGREFTKTTDEESFNWRDLEYVNTDKSPQSVFGALPVEYFSDSDDNQPFNADHWKWDSAEKKWINPQAKVIRVPSKDTRRSFLYKQSPIVQHSAYINLEDATQVLPMGLGFSGGALPNIVPGQKSFRSGDCDFDVAPDATRIRGISNRVWEHFSMKVVFKPGQDRVPDSIQFANEADPVLKSVTCQIPHSLGLSESTSISQAISAMTHAVSMTGAPITIFRQTEPKECSTTLYSDNGENNQSGQTSGERRAARTADPEGNSNAAI